MRPKSTLAPCACGCGKLRQSHTEKGIPRRFISGHNGHTGTLAERFWAKVDRSGGPEACWPWTAGTAGRGYGSVRVGPASAGHDYAHRVAYALTNGPIPPGALIRHDCDNPPCCNPAHLRPGSVADNTADMLARGRGSNGAPVLGSAHANAKLDEVRVAEIRRAHAAGRSQRALASDYGVSPTLVWAIVHRRVWRSVD